jgi:Ca2+-binding EF-hand superfamily protein
MEIKLSRDELNQILAFLPSLTAEHFIRSVIAKIDGYELVSPSSEELFNSLYGESTVGITVEHLIKTFNSADYSEVVEGVSLYLNAYSLDTPGVIIREEFDLMLNDFYCAIPFDYGKVLTHLFK